MIGPVRSEAKAAIAASAPKKLSYNDQRELDALPKQIETLEKEIEQLQQQLNDPDLYARDVDSFNLFTAQLTEKEQELEHAFTRWQELEGA